VAVPLDGHFVFPAGLVSTAFQRKKPKRFLRRSARCRLKQFADPVRASFEELELRISDLDKPVAISYLEKDVGKTLFASNSSDDQNSSNYQLAPRIRNARQPNE